MFDNWIVDALLIIVIAVLIVWVKGNFYLAELTPAPPWIKLSRRQKPTMAQSTEANSAGNGPQANRNRTLGENEIDIVGPTGQANDNMMVGKNKIRINSGRKSSDEPKGKHNE